MPDQTTEERARAFEDKRQRKAIFAVSSPDSHAEDKVMREMGQDNRLGSGSAVHLEARDEDLLYVRIGDKVLIDRMPKGAV